MLVAARDLVQLALHMLPFTRYPYRGELIDCPVCGNDESVQVARLDRRWKRLPTAMCARCGLFFTNPMPLEGELQAYYEKHYRLDYQLSRSRPRNSQLEKHRRRAHLRVGKAKELLAPGARTLDVGAGSGECVAQMLEAGFDAHGFEPGTAYGSYARDRLGDRIRITDWQTARYDEQFDLVTCFDVLEHLRSPLEAIVAMSEWLKPQGMLYVHVPNLPQLIRKRGISALHFAHVVGFNHYNLRLAAACAGFCLSQMISSTVLIFRRGEDENRSELAQAGLKLSRESIAETKFARAYLGHQLKKIGLIPSDKPATAV